METIGGRAAIFRWKRAWAIPLIAFSVSALGATPQASAPPVAYSSVNQLNQMLAQLEQISQTTQVDLAKVRIEKWKTDGNSKRQTQGNLDSVQRNLQAAMPEIIGQLKGSPENLSATFKLYRNLEALYDVFGSVVESAGAFGSRDEFQSLQNDLSAFEKSRREFADRMEILSGAKEVELTRLRSQLQNAQTAVSAPPKKVIVDDTEPPAKKIPSRKKSPQSPATKPASGPGPASSSQ